VTRLATVILMAGTAARLTVLYEFFIAHRPLFESQSSYFWNATGRPSSARRRLGSHPLGHDAGDDDIDRSFAAPDCSGLARPCLGVPRRFACRARRDLTARRDHRRRARIVLYLLLLRPPVWTDVFVGIVLLTVVGLFVLPSVTRTSCTRKASSAPESLAVASLLLVSAWP